MAAGPSVPKPPFGMPSMLGGGCELVLRSSAPRLAHEPLHLEPAGRGPVLPSMRPG